MNLTYGLLLRKTAQVYFGRLDCKTSAFQHTPSPASHDTSVLKESVCNVPSKCFTPALNPTSTRLLVFPSYCSPQMLFPLCFFPFFLPYYSILVYLSFAVERRACLFLEEFRILK